jgi:hypothetical protein
MALPYRQVKMWFVPEESRSAQGEWSFHRSGNSYLTVRACLLTERHWVARPLPTPAGSEPAEVASLGELA